jgi:hypothetical protein
MLELHMIVQEYSCNVCNIINVEKNVVAVEFKSARIVDNRILKLDK